MNCDSFSKLFQETFTDVSYVYCPLSLLESRRWWFPLISSPHCALKGRFRALQLQGEPWRSHTALHRNLLELLPSHPPSQNLEFLCFSMYSLKQYEPPRTCLKRTMQRKKKSDSTDPYTLLALISPIREKYVDFGHSQLP